jgi:hypothetical protein
LKLKRNDSNYPATCIALSCCIIFFLLQTATTPDVQIFSARSTRNRDSIQQRISDRTRSKRILNVTRKLRSLLKRRHGIWRFGDWFLHDAYEKLEDRLLKRRRVRLR